MMAQTGGCQCGAVRYTWSTERIAAYACHCRECQKQSASAFAISVPARKRDLDITGRLQVYQRQTDSGSTTNCWLCAVCGTRIYHQSARSPEMVTLKGGTLDNAADLRPVAHLWTSRKHPWLRLAPDAVTFATQPDDLRAWRDGLLDPP